VTHGKLPSASAESISEHQPCLHPLLLTSLDIHIITSATHQQPREHMIVQCQKTSGTTSDSRPDASHRAPTMASLTKSKAIRSKMYQHEEDIVEQVVNQMTEDLEAGVKINVKSYTNAAGLSSNIYQRVIRRWKGHHKSMFARGATNQRLNNEQQAKVLQHIKDREANGEIVLHGELRTEAERILGSASKDGVVRPVSEQWVPRFLKKHRVKLYRVQKPAKPEPKKANTAPSLAVELRKGQIAALAAELASINTTDGDLPGAVDRLPRDRTAAVVEYDVPGSKVGVQCDALLKSDGGSLDN